MFRLILLVAALVGTTSSAETLNTLQPARFESIVPPHFDCHKVDGRTGWQRLGTSQYKIPTVYPMGPRAASAYRLSGPDSTPGWTVDAARYDAVGARGHLGAAAEGLKPYDGYKFSQDYPFGALLVRYGTKSLFHLHRTDKTTSLDTPQPWVDFRINDTGFGDNAGYMIVCLTDLSNFK